MMKAMMQRIKCIAVVALAVVGVVSCIKNDIPHPVVKLDILTLVAEGTIGEAHIDATAHTVDLVLEETTDIRNVNITEVTMTEGAQSSVTFPGRFDLRHPLYVVLSMYQDYEWTIAAEQTIERYFRVEGQIGESVIDPVNHVATAYVPLDADLNAVNITAVKLGPKDITTYAPDPLSLTSFDNSVRHVTVSYHGDIEEMWTLCVVPTDVEVTFTSVDAWAKRIWLYAEGRSGVDLGFRYRKTGDEEWTAVNDITVNGGSFSACIEGLEPLTSYDVIAFSGENITPIKTVTTEDTYTLLNGGMEDWSFADKCYFPYADGAAPFWGTGNPGATTLGDAYNLTTPSTSDIRPGTLGTTSANLQSMFPNMAGIGKFAAGNIFLGRFAGTIGTNGIVHFGRPTSARPVALHGWVKYDQGTIDKVGKLPASRPDLAVGSPDEGQILIAVGDWTAEEYGGDADSPVAIDTRDENTFFNKNSAAVIGVGEMLLTESTDGWYEFTLPLEYKSTSRIPTHMVIVFTCSRFGDYFTGSTQSKMVVDDVELIF